MACEAIVAAAGRTGSGKMPDRLCKNFIVRALKHRRLDFKRRDFEHNIFREQLLLFDHAENLAAAEKTEDTESCANRSDPENQQQPLPECRFLFHISVRSPLRSWFDASLK